MIIKEGTHKPFSWPRIYTKMQVIRYDVYFTETCRYDLKGPDQDDINKLFGIGYFPHHQQNSVRFGWNYSKMNDSIRIYGYWYRDGLRYSRLLGDVKLGMWNTYVIMPSAKSHNLQVLGRGIASTVPVPGLRYGYHLGPYFGGNQKAPHDMTIMMTRL